MADGIPPVDGAANVWYQPPAGGASPAGAINKNMFLQLLVAQLRHQDPMQPSDGTQFVGQLAQFQQLETAMNTGEDIAAIRADLDVFTAKPKS